jgi:hypothetical protein
MMCCLVDDDDLVSVGLEEGDRRGLRGVLSFFNEEVVEVVEVVVVVFLFGVAGV